jgi:hypothetical protein
MVVEGRLAALRSLPHLSQVQHMLQNAASDRTAIAVRRPKTLRHAYPVGSVHKAPEKAQPVACQGVLRRGNGPPNPNELSKIRDGRVECLNDQESLIVDFSKSLSDFVPSHLPVTWRSTIILAHMHVFEVRSGPANGRSDILFFDRHVKRVEVDTTDRASNRFDKGNCVFRYVQEVRFKAV